MLNVTPIRSWQTVAKELSTEEDPKRIQQLAQELISRFDEERKTAKERWRASLREKSA